MTRYQKTRRFLVFALILSAAFFIILQDAKASGYTYYKGPDIHKQHIYKVNNGFFFKKRHRLHKHHIQKHHDHHGPFFHSKYHRPHSFFAKNRKHHRKVIKKHNPMVEAK